MRSILILSISLVLIITQTLTNMASAKTEKQNYRVVYSDNDFEIRFYPSATMATVNSGARTYKELSGPGFRSLAGYIFGGNASGTKISMTSPVHMDISDSGSSMSFVMPSSYNEKNLPEPDNSNVSINTAPDEYVAAIRFGGYASDSKIRHYSDKLSSMLVERGITGHGKFRFLGYNPPFQLFGRRNEIIVTVDWTETKR
jgi:hypothetical protein